jgi:hypothetical protein
MFLHRDDFGSLPFAFKEREPTMFPRWSGKEKKKKIAENHFIFKDPSALLRVMCELVSSSPCGLEKPYIHTDTVKTRTQ